MSLFIQPTRDLNFVPQITSIIFKIQEAYSKLQFPTQTKTDKHVAEQSKGKKKQQVYQF